MKVRMMNVRRLLTWQLAAVCFCSLLWLGTAEQATAAPLMTSKTIADEIDDELLFDPGVNSSQVDVNVIDGVATIKGEVNNLLAKERAARIATTVKGVRSVINQIQVEPSPTRTDDEIQRDIDTALLEDPAADSFEIDAEVTSGVATLTGNVQSYQERDLVLTVAKGVRGVRDVIDNIEVDYRTARSDAEIRREIEQALKWNMYVDGHLINVSVDDGQVALSGTVGSAAEKSEAEYAAWVAGVSEVDVEKLNVERWARDDDLRGDKYATKTPDEIRNAVNDALMLDPRVLSTNVDVEVVGSLVTLRGEVDNLKAKRAAEMDARNTVGVSYVTNRIKVRPESTLTDAAIEKKIDEAFVRDPYVERFEINTVVINGTAHLYGTVDSYFEKSQADDVASRVNGVVDVKNYLDADYNGPYFYDPYIDDGYVGDVEVYNYDRRAPTKTDAEIKEAIESEVWWSPFVNSDNVAVVVEDGVATLTGIVGSWAEHRAATENAYEGGATLVDNDLVVDLSD